MHLLSQKKNSNSDQIDGHTSQYIHLVHKYSRNEKQKTKTKTEGFNNISPRKTYIGIRSTHLLSIIPMKTKMIE